MERSEAAQRLIQQGITPQAADYAVSLISTDDVSEDQVARLADAIRDVGVGDTRFRSAVASAVPVGRRDTKEDGKAGAGKGSEGVATTDKDYAEDVKSIKQLILTDPDVRPNLSRLGKTDDDIEQMVEEQLKANAGDKILAGGAVQRQLSLEITALDDLRSVGIDASLDQIQTAIQSYNSRQRPDLHIKDLSQVGMRARQDALFSTILRNMTRTSVMDSTFTVTDFFGKRHSLPADKVGAYMKQLSLEQAHSPFSQALADSFSEYDRKVKAGVKDAADYGYEVLAPFITDSLRSYSPEDDPDGYATLDAMLDAQSAAGRYRANLAAYGEGHPLAALVGLVDQELATKMMGIGLTEEEARRAQRLLKNTDEMDLPGTENDSMKFYLEAYKKAQAGSSGGGREIVLPDRNKISEGFRELYRAWFKVDPTEPELEGLINETTAQFVASQHANTSPDLAADMVARTRQTDLYQRLFKNKAAGASEEQYVGQFEGAARQLLGGEIANAGSIQAGMESGNIATTYGAVAGSKQALENSTFRERLANAAQLISRMT